ncbi:hypothetical protein [Sphingobacterium sp. WOUb80]|uniref:hypothetical protein n=1 Tax=Sphingobacterium sp. WOUb80 TaxID=3234028 RepID=UPI003CE886BB
MKTQLITFLLYFIMLSASAHAVFMDTSLKGVKGKSHTVKVVYDEHEMIPSIQIIAPSGWIKWMETDDNGIVRFTPEWKGKYFTEVSKKEKAEGQAFEEYSRASSMSFAVK